MEKDVIIAEIKNYFLLQEFVSRNVYNTWGERAWAFLDEKMLETLLVIRRDILKVGLVVNDWKFGGKHQQRGLRENTCQIVKQKTDAGIMYISSHCLGKAFDVVCSKMSADEMRNKIIENAYLLPYPIRIESEKSAPTWLHVDTLVSDFSKKITKFS